MSTEPRAGGSVEALLAEVERLRDLEERVRAENEDLIETQQAFEETRDGYLDLFEFTPLACLVLAVDGSVEKLNATAVALLAHERPHLVGAFFHTLLIPPDRRRFLDHLRECRETRDRVSCEVRMLRRDEQAMPLHVMRIPLHPIRLSGRIRSLVPKDPIRNRSGATSGMMIRLRVGDRAGV